MPLLGFPPYVEQCAEVAAKGYEGFALRPDVAGELGLPFLRPKVRRVAGLVDDGVAELATAPAAGT